MAKGVLNGRRLERQLAALMTADVADDNVDE
jgi:hypothetical protein